MRAIQAANPDIVFVAAYPPDTVGIVRAAHEIGLKPKMFGGTMIGLLITPIKMQLGPILDGLVIMESFVPAPTFNFPGVADVLKRYRVVAAGEKIDPLGYGFVPFGYAAGQVLAQAVAGAQTLDQDKLAEYIHSHKFTTVVGEVQYGADGEWTKGRTVFTQFRNVAPHEFDQFATGKVQPIVWPPEYKTGDLIYPYTDARIVVGVLLAFAAELLELGEHRFDLQIFGLLRSNRFQRLFFFGRRGNGRRQQRCARRLDWHRFLLGGALNFEVEIDLRREAERHRIERREVCRIPVAAIADRLDGRFGGPDQPHDLAVLQLRMVAHQPKDGVRPVLPA